MKRVLINLLTQAPIHGKPLGVRFRPAQLSGGPVAGLDGWYVMGDIDTLFQDSAGTLPVTATGQPLGLILDQSGSGHNLSQPGVGKPIYNNLSATLGLAAATAYRLRYNAIATENMLWSGLTGSYWLAVHTLSGIQFYQTILINGQAIPKNEFIELCIRVAAFTAQEKADLTTHFNLSRTGIPVKDIILECGAASYTGRAGSASGVFGWLFGSGASYATMFNTLQVTTPRELLTFDIGTNTNLAQFNFNSNQIYGNADLREAGFTALNRLSGYTNKLTGRVPDLVKYPVMQTLWLSNNYLTGSITDFSVIPNAIDIDLNNNDIEGSIPPITALTVLTALNLAGNKFINNIPSLSGNTALGWVSFAFNNLTGFDGGTVSATIGTFEVQSNLLTQVAVDALLAAFVVAGRTSASGTCILNLGGTGNAAPSAAGLADKTTLTTRGWTVTTN